MDAVPPVKTCSKSPIDKLAGTAETPPIFHLVVPAIIKSPKYGARITATRPKEVARFSLEEGEKVNGKDALPVSSSGGSFLFFQPRLKHPKLPLDLAPGMEGWSPSTSSSSLNPILAVVPESQLSEVDFVSWRNNFNKLMASPYTEDSWIINVQRKGKTIYLDVVLLKDAEEEERHRKFMYWGSNFETLMTETTRPAGASFVSVVRLQIGKLNVLLGAEVDCYLESEDGDVVRFLKPAATPSALAAPPAKRQKAAGDLANTTAAPVAATAAAATVPATDVPPNTPAPLTEPAAAQLPPPGRIAALESAADPPPPGGLSAQDTATGTPQRVYVELKTTRRPDNPKALAAYERHKLLKFWVQSYLAGIPWIVVGLRDDEGVVHKLEALRTLDLPKRAKHKWDPSDCLTFTHEVLRWLQEAKLAEGARYHLRCSEGRLRLHTDVFRPPAPAVQPAPKPL